MIKGIKSEGINYKEVKNYNVIIINQLIMTLNDTKK